jgi:hypothetical protein
MSYWQLTETHGLFFTAISLSFQRLKTSQVHPLLVSGELLQQKLSLGLRLEKIVSYRTQGFCLVCFLAVMHLLVIPVVLSCLRI